MFLLFSYLKTLLAFNHKNLQAQQTKKYAIDKDNCGFVIARTKREKAGCGLYKWHLRVAFHGIMIIQEA